MRKVCRTGLLLLLCGTAPRAVLAQTTDNLGPREEFMQAWSQVTAAAPTAADSPELRRYLLYPYLQAERLRVSVSRVAAGSRDADLEGKVRAFLKAHPDAPVTRALRRDTLEYFGQREAWADFQSVQAVAADELSDPALRCYGFSARLAAGALDGLREAVLAQWLEQRQTPKSCEPVYAWLDNPQRLSDAEIEQRARFAASQRLPLPAALNNLLPARRAAMLFWHRLLEQPEKGLKRFLAGENLLARESLPAPAGADLGETLLSAFDLLARRDSKRARALFEALAGRKELADPERDRLRRAYALGLAYDHDPEAVKQFKHLPESALDTLSHEWRVRAALLDANWKGALQWIEAMPDAQRQEPRWRYWRARALERRGQDKPAQDLYAEVAKEREYYGFLAAERLKRKPELRHQPLAEDWPTLDLLAAMPALQRARELFLCELPELAATEFRRALRDTPASAWPQAARLASNWGWHERAVMLLSELQLWDDLWLRFPLPYDGEIEAAARDTGLPADWLYAVLRTESLYNPRAVSQADALGLLQLRLGTARQVAKRASLMPPLREDLFRPEINVALGARYLREIQERFGRRFILTLAAYNAGPQRVPGWLPESEVPGDIWVENIPYNETRTYIQRALSSLVIIGWRRNGEPTPILPLLSPVTPKDDDEKSLSPLPSLRGEG